MKLRIVGVVAAALIGVQPAPASSQVSGAWKIPFEGSASEPVVHEGILYIGAFDGSFQAIDPRSGKPVWRYQTGVGLTSGPEIIVAPGRRFEDAMGAALSALGQEKGRREILATPVVDNSTVYVGARDFKFYALDARTGQLRWSTDIRQPISRKALSVGDVVLVHGAGQGSERSRNAVFALDKSDGRVLWSTEGRGQATYPAVSGELVFYGRKANPGNDASAVATPAVVEAADIHTGQVRWRQQLRGEPPEEVFTASGLVLATSFTGGELVRLPDGVDYAPIAMELIALRADSGQLAWRYSAGPFRPSRPPELVIGKEHLYFVSPQGLHAIRIDTGQRAWLLEGTFSQFEMTIREALLFVHGDSSSGDDRIYAVDTRTGKVSWSYRDKNLFYTRAEADVLYISADERLLAIATATGKVLWKFKTGRAFKQGPRVSAKPIVFGQHVIFPTETNVIWGRDAIQGQLFSVNKSTGKIE